MAATLPWLAHLSGPPRDLERSCVDVAGLLNSHNPDGFRFVRSAEVLKALDYEHRVSTGMVPTRDALHDWYNGLVWLTYPSAKRLFNRLHVEQGQRAMSSGNRRTPLRDALTLMDESGALLLTCDPELGQALLNHDWNSLFVRKRAAWLQSGGARLLIVGHGLLESMHKPHKGLCAKVIPVQVKTTELPAQEVDRLLVEITLRLNAPGNFCPMPVMGVPGWFEASNTLGFYDDSAVFRAKPTPTESKVTQRLAFRWDGTTLRS